MDSLVKTLESVFLLSFSQEALRPYTDNLLLIPPFEDKIDNLVQDNDKFIMWYFGVESGEIV